MVESFLSLGLVGVQLLLHLLLHLSTKTMTQDRPKYQTSCYHMTTVLFVAANTTRYVVKYDEHKHFTASYCLPVVGVHILGRPVASNLATVAKPIEYHLYNCGQYKAGFRNIFRLILRLRCLAAFHKRTLQVIQKRLQSKIGNPSGGVLTQAGISLATRCRPRRHKPAVVRSPCDIFV